VGAVTEHTFYRYYLERGHRRGRLVAIVAEHPSKAFCTVVSVCGRDGEECKTHRAREVSMYRLRQTHKPVETAHPCECLEDGFSSHVEVEDDTCEGDCYFHHKVFVCSQCQRVAPWCYGGPADEFGAKQEVDPEGTLCNTCAVANVERNESQPVPEVGDLWFLGTGKATHAIRYADGERGGLAKKAWTFCGRRVGVYDHEAKSRLHVSQEVRGDEGAGCTTCRKAEVAS
jgi:hypothetical protein